MTEHEEAVRAVADALDLQSGRINPEFSVVQAEVAVEAMIRLGYRKQEPVSEPTEAEVEAAFKSWNGWHVGTVRDRLRAALVAARAVTNGDEQKEQDQ